MIYGVKQDDLIDSKHKCLFLKVLKLPIYSYNNLFGYKFHHVIVQLTKISIFIKHEKIIGSNEKEDLLDDDKQKEMFI
jgi:hypothetical protein